jgi:hypothetical protein
MGITLVNLGTYENDGTGDDLRTAFEKANANFADLDLTRVIFADNLGQGAPVFRNKIGNNLQFRSIKSSNTNTTVSFNDTEVILSVKDSINSVEEDHSPRLGGNLDLNNRDITGTGNISIQGEIIASQITGTLNGPFIGNLTGNVTGNLTGNVTGNLTGDVTGNVFGQVSDISNHRLLDLSDVSDISPNLGQALIWSGSEWVPETIVIPPQGVTRIIAGNNISISPSSGLGEVTINATSSGSITDINTFDLGNFRRIFTNPISYLLDQVGINFGTFEEPADFTVDLGTF